MSMNTGKESDSERRSQDAGGSNGTTWGDITKVVRNCGKRGVERVAYEELKEMYGEENIISAVIRDETTPHLVLHFKC